MSRIARAAALVAEFEGGHSGASKHILYVNLLLGRPSVLLSGHGTLARLEQAKAYAV